MNMNLSLFAPPILFILLLVVVLCLSGLLSKLAFQRQNRSEEQGKPYACGEDIPDQMIETDYSQFFPFAFFFTIMHVVALMIATVPAVTRGTGCIGIVYIVSAIIGLMILYRR
jgi:NADH:ubiquinone oxidoreductase subunit 3 (subunit A)